MRSSEKEIDRLVEPVTSVSGGFSAGVMYLAKNSHQKGFAETCLNALIAAESSLALKRCVKTASKQVTTELYTRHPGGQGCD
jgi:hypothetical protein